MGFEPFKVSMENSCNSHSFLTEFSIGFMPHDITLNKSDHSPWVFSFVYFHWEGPFSI